MKPMEYCLDAILLKLVEDWDNYGDDRKDLNCEELLTSFDLPPQYRKHEFFIRLIDKLVADGCAELINSRSALSKIDMYQRNTIITIEGYFLITHQGGYTQQKNNADAENNRIRNIETSQLSLSRGLNIVTAWIAGGTIALVLIELWKMALEHNWFSYAS